MPQTVNERGSTSDSPSSELIKALIKFQQTCPSIAKDKEGYGYKYTPLEKFLSVVNPALNKVGLAQSQSYDFAVSPDGESSKTIIVTTLFHESGASITSRLPLREPLGKNAKKDIMHEWGGITTYSRRYALKTILGLEPDMDMNMEDTIVREETKGSKPSPWEKPELKQSNAKVIPIAGVPDDDQPLDQEERNLLLGLIREDPNKLKFFSDFRDAFELSKGAKISPHIKTKKHERFYQQWKA